MASDRQRPPPVFITACNQGKFPFQYFHWRRLGCNGVRENTSCVGEDKANAGNVSELG